MPNIMGEIASDLGVRLGERFRIKVDGKIEDGECILRETGFFVDSGNGQEWSASSWLKDVLTGEAEIVKLPWRPEEKGWYYFWVNNSNVASNFGGWYVSGDMWRGNTADVGRLAMGNYFQTEKEAFAHEYEIIQRYCDTLEGR